MQPSRGQKAPGNADTLSGEFFVPDLCGPRAVFVMVILAELLVLVHTLATTAFSSYLAMLFYPQVAAEGFRIPGVGRGII